MTATATKAVRTLVAAATSNTAGSTTRGTQDLRTAFGGLLTIKMTNGATGPTIACACNILVAHNTGSTPTAASAGSDWKTIHSFSGGTTNSAVTEKMFAVPDAAMHLEVEFTGNTGQTVTVEAILSELSSIANA